VPRFQAWKSHRRAPPMRADDVTADSSAGAPLLGVGVIGLGEIGQFHLAGFDLADGAKVVAVADLDADLRASSAGPRGASAYASYTELLGDSSVDIVSVCLPHSLHREVALGAIAAGKHVLIEKPLAMDLSECDEIIGAAAGSGLVAGVQHNQLFYTAHIRARELIDAGELGKILHIRLRLGIGGKYSGWRADPALAGGGLLHDAGVHRLYLAPYFGGAIEEVLALTDSTATEVEDQAVIALRFASGALGVIDVNYHGPAGMFDDSIEIVGTKGALYISGCEADFEGFRAGPAIRRYDDGWRDELVTPGRWDDSVNASIGAFVEAVQTGSAAPVTLADGRRVLELIAAVHNSPAPVTVGR